MRIRTALLLAYTASTAACFPGPIEVDATAADSAGDADTTAASDSLVTDSVADSTVAPDVADSTDVADSADAADSGDVADSADVADGGCATDCHELDDTCAIGVCRGGQCVVAGLDSGTCDDGDPCTREDQCDGGVCKGIPLPCDDGVACTVDSCSAGACEHDPASCECAKDEDCSDHDACTGKELCGIDRVCREGAPVDCAPATSPCLENTCDKETGQCGLVPAHEGADCDDGDACTTVDKCASGSCIGGTPVVCAAKDDCHVAGVCNSASGECSNPTAPPDSECDDHDACTRDDRCAAGVCEGRNPVTCQAKDACHVPGVCQKATGVCTDPAGNENGNCDDQSKCTQNDKCHGGVCSGSAIVCQSTGPCREPGTCDPATGTCSSPFKQDDTPCDEGNLCTLDDHCEGGTCIRTDLECQPLDECHVAGTCNPSTGLCTDPEASDTTSCDDGDYCTVTDTCDAGACFGSGRPDDAPTDWVVGTTPVTVYGVVPSTGGGVGPIPIWHASEPRPHPRRRQHPPRPHER
ncbi:MAG: hypothetical protein U1F43_25695 [Myxococcota bacterium]